MLKNHKKNWYFVRFIFIVLKNEYLKLYNEFKFILLNGSILCKLLIYIKDDKFLKKCKKLECKDISLWVARVMGSIFKVPKRAILGILGVFRGF